MPDDISEADLNLVEKHCEQLGEHFDSVHIFCTRHEPATEGGTINVTFGFGNWYARYGQVREWLIRNEEQARDAVREK